MAINIVEAIYSETGVVLDLASASTTANNTVGDALKQFNDDNSENPDFLPEYVTFSIESIANTNLSSMGLIDGVIPVWRLRENGDPGDTEVTLEKYQSGNVFTHLVPDGYETYAMSSGAGTYIYTYPGGSKTKASGTQDALTSTPNTISSTDSYEANGSSFGDTIIGTDNSDTLNGRAGRDVLLGEGGADLLLGRGGFDRLEGGAGFDELRGGNGNDTLLGGNGNDNLVGGNQDDFLAGNNGSDILTGGADADQFAYFLSDMVDARDNGSRDTITDFTDADGDIILLNNGIEAFSFADRNSAGLGDTVFRNTEEGTQLYTRISFNGGLGNQFALYANVVDATLDAGDFTTA